MKNTLIVNFFAGPGAGKSTAKPSTTPTNNETQTTTTSSTNITSPALFFNNHIIP